LAKLAYRFPESFLKKLVGRTDIEDALERLDKLTQEEARMATAEGLKATHSIDNKVEDVGDKVKGVDSKIHGVHVRVKDIGDQIAGAQITFI
jgi:hypothetical protein